MDAAAAAVHRDAAVTVVSADCGRQLKMRMGTSAGAELALYNNIRPLHRLMHIALIEHVIAHDIGRGSLAGELAFDNIQPADAGPRIRCIDYAVAMAGCRINDRLWMRIKSFLNSQDMRQLFVLQFDCIDSVFSQLHRIRRNNGNRLTRPDALTIHRKANRFRKTLHMERRTLGREDPCNARHGLRSAHIELRDLTMRHRAAQNFYMQQIRNELIVVAGE